ncbi:MAG TPA: class A beta-lactamase-related serine hydrolase [Paludibacteraceae bacterium]|nr:class A beta-lactamase-related serine hydrolase [Paludibacteraceae bacterium]HPT43439.1 class A beta-lactamase-related serine hydrolase [Paludibacteraceae bacterium]
MKKICAVILLMVFVSGIQIHAQKTDKKLTKLIENEVSDFNGVAGVYVKNLKTGREVTLNADTLFPTASTIKVPIMVGVFNKIINRQLDYYQPLTYSIQKQLYAGDDGLIASLRDSSKVSLSIVQMLSITTSDNSASLWLQELAGTGTEINNLMDNIGLKHTRVNSRTPGREAIREIYGWGHTTPREMAGLLVKIRNREILTPAACDEMYRILGTIYYDDRALSQIPPTVKTASKQGMVSDARSEVVLVNAPHGDYVFAVYTKNQKDLSWKKNNEGRQLIVEISKLLWNYFEPGFGWKPAEGNDEYNGAD